MTGYNIYESLKIIFKWNTLYKFYSYSSLCGKCRSFILLEEQTEYKGTFNIPEKSKASFFYLYFTGRYNGNDLYRR